MEFQAVWAIRSSLYRASYASHRFVFNILGMDRFYKFVIPLFSQVVYMLMYYRLLTSDQLKVRQQATILVRNTTTVEACWNILLEGLGTEKIFGVLANSIESEDEDILTQVRTRTNDSAVL